MSDQLNDVSNILEQHTFPQEETVAEKKQEFTQPQESQKETNMRILRERAEAAERRALELERTMQMNMSQQHQSTKMQVVDEDDDFELGDDTYIEGKHLKKYVNNLKKELKNTRRQFEEYNQLQAMAQAEMKLKHQFADFDTVVSRDNLEKLQQQKPALYRTILANTDIYDKGYAAYELIKSSGILTDQYEELDRRVEENRSRPRSAANASPQSGDTPLTRVGDYDRRILTEDRKAQLRKQVEEAKRYKQ